MEKSAKSLERRRIKSIAKEYKEKGYTVTVGPRHDELPVFLHNAKPDIVATRGDDNVVIEVKTSTTVSTTDEVMQLAKLVENRPEWRFELVITNPRGRRLSEEPEQELSAQQLWKRLREAGRLVEIGSLEAALLLGWSTAEGAARSLLQSEGTELKKHSPGYVIKRAYSDGLMTQRDYDVLRKAITLRNTIVHGYAAKSISWSQVSRILRATKRLMYGTEPQGRRSSVKAVPDLTMETAMAKPRDTYKYQFKVGNKIVHGGITDDLERREAEHQQKWPKGLIKQVGRRTTEKVAREWEKDKGYT